MRWFVSGFVLGSVLFMAACWLGTGAEFAWLWTPLRWSFSANPFLWLICDVLQRRELCIGLPLDGGPLEWLDRAWMYVAPGLSVGTLAWLLGAMMRRRRVS